MTVPSVPYRFELELEVAGTAEQVWAAIATAEGISSWMVPTRLEPREGGALSFDMGPEATSNGRVTAFEPSRRFAYEEDWAALVGRSGNEVTPLLTEFLVEARSGGTCVVRVVTSAFGTGADWENEFWDEMETGWGPMLHNLRLYLARFPGQRAASLWAGAEFAATPVEAVAAVRRELRVNAVGDPVAAKGLSGRTERCADRHFLLLLEGEVPGYVSFSSFGTAKGSGVHLQGCLFGDAAPAYVEREQPAWQDWLEGVSAAG